MSRVCAKCGTWIFWDNGDVTYHCGCGAGWKFEEEAMKMRLVTEFNPTANGGSMMRWFLRDDEGTEYPADMLHCLDLNVFLFGGEPFKADCILEGQLPRLLFEAARLQRVIAGCETQITEIQGMRKLATRTLLPE